MNSSLNSKPTTSSCSGCSSSRAQPSPAIDGVVSTTGEYRKWSDSVYALSKERIPWNGAIEIIENCNFRCVHCYQGNNKARSYLSLQEWATYLDQFAEMGTLWLLITGGEPLLHPEFKDIYLYAIKKGFIVTVFTNGRLLKDDHIQLFRDYPPFAVEITLYGSDEETYEKVTGTKGSFEKVLENAKKLQKSGVPLKLKSVGIKPLVSQMKSMQKIAMEEVGVKFKYDSKIDPTIYGDSLDHIRPSAEESVALEASMINPLQIRQELERLGNFNQKNLEKKETQPFLYQCGAGKVGFYVDYLGRVNTCSIGRLMEEDFRLSKYSFREIWEEYLPAVIYQEAKNKNLVCRSCEYRKICDVCPATAKLATGSKEKVPEYVCKHTMARKKFILERKKMYDENTPEKEISKTIT